MTRKPLTVLDPSKLTGPELAALDRAGFAVPLSTTPMPGYLCVSLKPNGGYTHAQG